MSSKTVNADATHLADLKCTCRFELGSCLDKFTLGEIRQLRMDHEGRSGAEKKTWLIEQMRTMGSVKKQAHFPYTVLGRPVCRHGFRNLHNLSYYMLNQSKDAITQNKGALTVHGNSMLNVQGARAEMMEVSAAGVACTYAYNLTGLRFVV